LLATRRGRGRTLSSSLTAGRLLPKNTTKERSGWFSEELNEVLVDVVYILPVGLAVAFHGHVIG
jgi:hypothetical protein